MVFRAPPLKNQRSRLCGSSALRLYSGPIYAKYNTVLRGAVCSDFVEYLESVCKGNHYPTTLHVLAQAILKLGLLNTTRHVYRAPGGALPPNFWRRCCNGTVGILEPGCLSASTSKEEALKYARKSKAGLLFEIHQGFVARGACLAELSQHPNEEEVLLPT